MLELIMEWIKRHKSAIDNESGERVYMIPESELAKELYPNETDAVSYLRGVLDGRKGYVKLAKNQDLPEGVGQCMDCLDSYKMLKAGFRKVEL